MQAAHPAKLVGAFLDLRLRHLDARFPRAQRRQSIPDELLQECSNCPVSFKVRMNSSTSMAWPSIFTMVAI